MSSELRERRPTKETSSDSLDEGRQLPPSSPKHQREKRRGDTVFERLTTVLAVIACLVFLAAKSYGLIAESRQDWIDAVLVKAWDVVPLYGNLTCLLLLRVFDAFFAPSGARWFAIHTFANLFVVIFCTHGLFAVLADPSNATNVKVHPDTPSTFSSDTFGATSRWPIFMINTVHMYHLLFFSLKADERFHHFVFIPLVGIPGQVYRYGALQNYTSFFISGFPGGVSYFNLVLAKLGVMSKLRQKKIDKYMNVWCRCPGYVCCSSLSLSLSLSLTLPD